MILISVSYVFFNFLYYTNNPNVKQIDDYIQYKLLTQY